MSGRIIRYGTMAARTNPYVRAGYAAYRYGPTAARAAGTIARWAFNRYRRRNKRSAKSMRRMRAAKKTRFSTRNIGHPVGAGTTKRVIQKETNPVTKDSRVLYTQNLTELGFGDDINQRQRQLINLRGFKLCTHFRNDDDDPIYLNVAVVHGKLSEAAPTSVEFFRGNGNSRGVDFGSGLTPLQFHCLNINTDSYVILRHKRYIIKGKANTATNYVDRSGKNYMTMKWWIPLKRQLRYESNASTQPTTGNVWLVYWADQIGATSGTASQLGVFTASERHITYFRETK